MVKGISKQVIVVHAPEQKMFEQVIFILRDEMQDGGVSDQELLQQANKLLRSAQPKNKLRRKIQPMLWSGAGAAITCLVWLAAYML